jgi:hypothetical protein
MPASLATCVRTAIRSHRSTAIALQACALVVAARLHLRAETCAASNPPQVYVVPKLQRVVKGLFVRSLTFRAQWDRLAREPRLYVRIRFDSSIDNNLYRARSVIRHTDAGIVAFVDIHPFGDPTEMLAHELEHVIEQLEGLNLARLAAARHEAWSTGHGVFETERAIRAGRRVLDEARARPLLAARMPAAPPDRAALSSRR